jgi:hypothetical protein
MTPPGPAALEGATPASGVAYSMMSRGDGPKIVR